MEALMAPAGTVHRSPSRLHFLKPSPNFVNSTFKFKPQQLYTFRNRCRTPLLPSLTSINCKLKSSREIKKQNASKKIELWNSAPPLSEEESNAGSGKKEPAKAGSGNSAVLRSVKKLSRKVLTLLSNLPLAIGEMFVIAALMAVGTVIDQGETPEYYFQMYPEDSPAFGFFTWRWVLALGFDHMFSSPVFLATLALLGASLMACTYTTQIPLVKVARRFG